MGYSHAEEMGSSHPATPPSRRSKDLAGPGVSRALFKGPLKPLLASGNRAAQSPPTTLRYMPLGENVNGLKNRSCQNQPASDKSYQDIYALGDTPAPPNGALSSLSRTRRAGSSTTTSASRTPKRKRVDTIEDSDSDMVMSTVGEFVRTARDPAPASDSGRRQDQGPRFDGTTVDHQASGLVGKELSASMGRLSEEEFDSLIYGQEGASQPPRGLFVRPKLMPPKNRSGLSADPSQRAESRLYVHMDPRVHWTHNRSEDWHRKKSDEIAFRGTRKENFGKAATRMQSKRLRQAMVDKAMPGRPVRNDRGSPEIGRHMDFGDVSETALPDMVKSNPEWLKAAAWMRKCRQKSVERQREIERRQKAGLPWKGLLGASGVK